MSDLKFCIIFDLDGTLTDPSHRLHFISGEKKNWDAFFDAAIADPPIHHILDLARVLVSSGVIVLFASGRSDRVREATAFWLRHYGLLKENSFLFMRKAGDHRSGDIVKGEILDEIIAAGFKPRLIFDDSGSVVKMWRSRGIPCCQVAEGDF